MFWETHQFELADVRERPWVHDLEPSLPQTHGVLGVSHDESTCAEENRDGLFANLAVDLRYALRNGIFPAGIDCPQQIIAQNLVDL